jgi:hypothetical protein
MTRSVSAIGWLLGVGVVSWLAVTAAVSPTLNPELFWGMAAPLVATVATWIAAARTHGAAPERLAGVMMTGFALKAVFFGVYVVVMLRVMMLRPVPFVVSFTAYFITLYAMEALLLRRLLRS